MKYSSTFLFYNLLILSCSLSAMHCASTSLILSDPPGAQVFVDGKKQGHTPIKIKGSSGFLGSRNIRVQSKNLEASITQHRTADAKHMGLCLPVLICTAWSFYWPAEEYLKLTLKQEQHLKQ